MGLSDRDYMRHAAGPRRRPRRPTWWQRLRFLLWRLLRRR